MPTKLKLKTEKSKIKSGPKAKSKKYVYAVGRRKTATARVRLYSGKGETVVNDQPISKYFSGSVAQIFYQKPFVATNTLGKYYVTIKVEGSGKNSQLEAVVHGIARALDKDNKELYHSLLKQQNLLTRDYRAKERRKPGQMGKARKQKQSPKR
jgi:small subunit ribosomal protein S9